MKRNVVVESPLPIVFFLVDFENRIVDSVSNLEVSLSHVPNQVITSFSVLVDSLSKDIDATSFNFASQVIMITIIKLHLLFHCSLLRYFISLGYINLESQDSEKPTLSHCPV